MTELQAHVIAAALKGEVWSSGNDRDDDRYLVIVRRHNSERIVSISQHDVIEWASQEDFDQNTGGDINCIFL